MRVVESDIVGVERWCQPALRVSSVGEILICDRTFKAMLSRVPAAQLPRCHWVLHPEHMRMLTLYMVQRGEPGLPYRDGDGPHLFGLPVIVDDEQLEIALVGPDD